jgi:hypothetical protein
MTTLTYDRLREVLNYDAPTGVFTWRIKLSRKTVVGRKAGSTKPSGYVSIRIDTSGYYAHRLAWCYVYGSWPEEEIDHINGLRADNRISNLRQASRKQNMENRVQATGSSGYRGVCWLEANQKWRASIVHNRKNIYLGLFETAEEASDAYNQAASHFHTHNRSSL